MKKLSILPKVLRIFSLYTWLRHLMTSAGPHKQPAVLGRMETKQSSPHLHCAESHTRCRWCYPAEDTDQQGAGVLLCARLQLSSVRKSMNSKNKRGSDGEKRVKNAAQGFSLLLIGSGPSFDKHCQASRPSYQLVLFVLKGSPLSKPVFPRRFAELLEQNSADLWLCHILWNNKAAGRSKVQGKGVPSWKHISPSLPWTKMNLNSLEHVSQAVLVNILIFSLPRFCFGLILFLFTCHVNKTALVFNPNVL